MKLLIFANPFLLPILTFLQCQFTSRHSWVVQYADKNRYPNQKYCTTLLYCSVYTAPTVMMQQDGVKTKRKNGGVNCKITSVEVALYFSNSKTQQQHLKGQHRYCTYSIIYKPQQQHQVLKEAQISVLATGIQCSALASALSPSATTTCLCHLGNMFSNPKTTPTIPQQKLFWN